jgi:Na+/phosphate symporter
MILATYLAPFVCVIGVLAYALSANAKIAELGRLAFFAGLLATLLQFARLATTVHLP